MKNMICLFICDSFIEAGRIMNIINQCINQKNIKTLVKGSNQAEIWIYDSNEVDGVNEAQKDYFKQMSGENK